MSDVTDKVTDAIAADLRAGFRQRILIEIHQQYIRTLLHKAFRGGLTDAAGTAGDDRYFTVQPSHVSPSPERLCKVFYEIVRVLDTHRNPDQ